MSCSNSRSRPTLFSSQACWATFILAAYSWCSASIRIDFSAPLGPFRLPSAPLQIWSLARVATTACQVLMPMPTISAATTAAAAVNTDSIAPPRLLKPVCLARRPGGNGLIVQVALDSIRQAVGCLIAARPVLLQSTS